MTQPPRDPRQPLVNRAFVGVVAWQGMLLASAALTAFFIGMRWYGAEGPGLRHAGTMAFTVLALAQVAHAVNVRSQRQSAFVRPFANRWLTAALLACVASQAAAVYWSPLQIVLHTVPLTPADAMVVVACSLAPVAVTEVVKRLGATPRARGLEMPAHAPSAP
jgi:Ca2+-transporting ATPase